MKAKIGLGVVTYNRPHYFNKIFPTIPLKSLDEIVVVNDGLPYKDIPNIPYVQHETNKGVGISKNDAIRHLLSKGCTHIFLMEDDIIIKDAAVFQKYITASKETGIQHFNYSQHGLMNKFPNSRTPSPKTIIQYSSDVSIALYPHCVGAFSYYTKKCLDKVGLMDEKFYNATEHLEHTYNIIKNGMHPPFWWFADLPDANKYLTDIPWSIEGSTISSNPNHRETVLESYKYFHEKHKIQLLQIPMESLDSVKQNLKSIYKNER